MSDSAVTVSSPLYVIKSFAICWKCGEEQEVIALSGRHPDEGKEPVLLTNIEAMPESVREYLNAKHPRFQKRHSKTADLTYYVNTCEGCQAFFGDWFLFSEPEGAFFPLAEEQAKRMTIVELPFVGDFEFRSSYGCGAGDLIFEHASRVP